MFLGMSPKSGQFLFGTYKQDGRKRGNNEGYQWHEIETGDAEFYDRYFIKNIDDLKDNVSEV